MNGFESTIEQTTETMSLAQEQKQLLTMKRITNFREPEGGGASQIQKGPGCSWYLLGVNKKRFCYLLGCLASPRSTAEAFAVPFKALSRKKYDKR